jgi:2-methylcitrate synthase
MAEGKVLTGAGLRGQVAGKTALSTVGKSGAGLTYRGYDVQDLAENCQFEEVAYLIFFGELPTAAQLTAYKAKLKSLRQLPQALKEVLERIPADSHPMDVMRTGVSMLGNLETEQSFAEQQDVADRIPFQRSFATGTALAMMVYVLKKIPMTTQSVLNSYTCCVVKSQMNCMNK